MIARRRLSWLAPLLVLVGCHTAPTAPAAAPPPAAEAPEAPALSLDLSGRWNATGYGCPDGSAPPVEVVDVVQDGGTIRAIKVVGDNCISAGQVTWEGTASGPSSFDVHVHVGAPGAPKTKEPATVRVTSADSFDVVATAGWSLSFQRQ